MKPAVRAVLLGLLLLLASAGCGTPVKPAEPVFTGNIKSIKVVSDDNYPPYIFRDAAGNLQGILIDQWALWEKKTGVHVLLTGLPWDKAVSEMKSGSFDVIDTIFENDERLKYFDFTKPYNKIDVPIFFSASLSGINGAESLQGFSVAVKKGDFSVGYLREHGITTLVEYDSYEAIINAARDKKVLVFVMDKPPALYLMAKAGISTDFRYTAPLYTGEFHRAVQKGAAEMITLVNKGFDEISAAELNLINTKWQGTEINYVNILPYAGYAVIIILLAIILLVLWNRSLKRMVGRRTGELEKALELLNMKQSENSAIIKAIPQLVLLLDNEGRFISGLTTKQSDEVTTPPSRFAGRALGEILPQELSGKLENALAALKNTEKTQRLEYSLPSNNGIQHYEATLSVCDSSRVLAFISNITERKKVELQLYELSIYDSLTHFYNRHYFEKKITEFEQSHACPIGYFTCDLDGLKLINDTMGHAEGDNYIRLAADIIRCSFGEQDIVARIGGDEFGILIQNASESLLEQKKDQLVSLISQANLADRPMPISMSLGYALWNDADVGLADILKIAEDSMYRDKLNHMQSIKSKNIELLTEMLQARDFITEGHGGRLQELAGALAQKTGLSASDVRDVMLLAKFHDIGKIGISDAILFKPGSLTDEEMQAMKRHTEIGYRIASSSPDLIHIADWILKHHEKVDGSGYPFGLKGNEIPIQCRIVAILDAYDAMTNDRPYRKAISRDKACAELKKCSGSQFDSNLIDHFLTILAGAE